MAFETKMLIKTLYRKASESNYVQFLHVFQSEMKKENEALLKNQMKFFIKAVRQCGKYGKYSYTKDFVIDIKGSKILTLNEDKEKNVKILSEIQSTEFWDLWNMGEKGETIFEKPHG